MSSLHEMGDVALEPRDLPSIQALLDEPKFRSLTRLRGSSLTALLRHELDGVRADIRAGRCVTSRDLSSRIARALSRQERARLSPIINATGIIIHTNLGRAPVSDAAAAAMSAAAASAVPLEIDPETNRRGGRMREIADMMRLLTGAEATLVVNNNAAAVFLVLSAMAAGGQVVLSRGEAVEIGGGFRIPDVLRQSGAELVEVGTTNRTYARDYAAAVNDRTALLMKVHPSNFRITGFTHEATVAELALVGEEHGLPVVDDQGSGLLLDTASHGLPYQATIGDSLHAGASIVTASGDKLLGGPQAGIIAGRATWVDLIERHPLARAVRADKTCLAGVAATLRHYARDEVIDEIPVWQMIAAEVDELCHRAVEIRGLLGQTDLNVKIESTAATTGGGSLPGETLPSVALVVGGASHQDGVEQLAQRLRTGTPGVFGRIEDDRLFLDLRTVRARDDQALAQAVIDASRPG